MREPKSKRNTLVLIQSNIFGLCDDAYLRHFPHTRALKSPDPMRCAQPILEPQRDDQRLVSPKQSSAPRDRAPTTNPEFFRSGRQRRSLL